MRFWPLTLVAMQLASNGCASTPDPQESWAAPPPETWSLSHLRQATLSDMERSPALRVELIVAIRVAYERCSKAESPIVKRFNIETFVLRAHPESVRSLSFGHPIIVAAMGQKMGEHYRYAYGDQWFSVLSREMQQVRAKYENHPDSAAFCRAVNSGLRRDLRNLGENRGRTARLERMYRQLSPENTRPDTEDDAR